MIGSAGVGVGVEFVVVVIFAFVFFLFSTFGDGVESGLVCVVWRSGAVRLSFRE
jgi:hypothetical protein